MGVTRQDLVRSGRYLEMSDEEWEAEKAVRQGVIDCYMANDKWGVNINKNVGVVLTSSIYGLPYLKASLATHKQLGFWTVLSYDNFIDPKEQGYNYNEKFPPKDIMDLVDTFLMTHHQTWGGVSYPYVWQLKLASRLMQNFEYVLCNNGDCVIEKPEGFPELLKMMGDADLMSSGPTLEREIGTAGFLVKGKAFAAIADHMLAHMMPFEEYEKSTQEFGNTEGRLAVAVRELGLKTAVVKPPFNEQHHEPGGGWYETIGFRHIHGEHNYAYRYHKIPPKIEYFDQRFMGDEYNQIKAYWETMDMEILKGWWAKD